MASCSAGEVEQPGRAPANKSPSRAASASSRTTASLRPYTRRNFLVWHLRKPKSSKEAQGNYTPSTGTLGGKK
jgi:hypothetical protein